MGKLIILGSCFLLILALIGKQLVDMGMFRRIEPKGLDKCRLIIPLDAEGEAYEDLAIDYENSVAYLAGDDRRWLYTFSSSILNKKKQGKVFIFDIKSATFTKLNIINYPYEHFHPLGINLLKRTKSNRLFMTNFRLNNSGDILGSVEIFEIDPSNGNQLVWIDSVVHPLFTVPDDVLAIDEKTFYVTNIYHYRKDQSLLMHTIEVFTNRPWTNLLLCSKTNEWQCSIIVDSIVAANGIVASLDFKTIYLATSTEKKIRVYQRHVENNSLSYRRTLDVPFIVDNLLVNEYDQLVAAGHPNAFLFILHEKDPREYRAPSEIVLFPEPKSNSTYKNLLLTNGELLSATTVGGTYKRQLIVGALYDPGILLCHDLF